MKKLCLIIMAIAAISVIWVSCGKDNIEIDKKVSGKSDSFYNQSVNEIAMTLSLALAAEPELRKLIKEEALKKFDGDYDILMSTLLKKNIKSTKKNFENIGFLDLLLEYKPKSSSNEKSKEDFINGLMVIYPDLQISVPINAEYWDDNYVPVVAIQPDNFVQGQDTHVPGYKNGEEELVDAYEPSEDKPVVVVGRNERGGGGGGTWYCNPPAVDITLTAETWTSSIYLSWTVGENTGGDIFGYQIYRKAQGSNIWEASGYTVGEYSTTYTDFLLIANNQYEYYITARCTNKTGQSAPSNIAYATAPDRPSPPEEFGVFQTGLNQAEIRWNYPEGETIISSEIWRKVDGVDSDYTLLASPGPNDYYFIDNSVPAHRKVNYRMNHSNLIGPSDDQKDFILGAERDISQPSNVYIDAVYVNSSEVESPIWGAPEFVLAVASVDPTTGLAVEVQSAMQINMCQGSSWFSEFDNKLVLNWEQWHWQERLTFKMVEHDNFTFDGDVTFGAEFLNKNADKTALDISGSANATLSYNGLSEDCGVAYYNYYDPINKIISFPNFDAQISLRIDDLPNQCEDED